MQQEVSGTTTTHGGGLIVNRVFTTRSTGPFHGVRWEKRTSRISNPDGSVVFEQDDVEVPSDWSQTATDILASKYFRKTGVPQPDGSLGGETSLKQVIKRLAHTWRVWGEENGYFVDAENADAFEDEISYMLVHQMAAPNSPQWFNTGLNELYGITGDPQGHWYVDHKTGELLQSDDAYTHPSPSACFIQSIEDDLVGENGIFGALTKEARIFKFGAGSGMNYSSLRGKGESLSGGGKSSGMMSFLKIFDTAAGAIKSGGTTRRSARLVAVDIDHPEIEDFINWKVEEERKVAALIKAGYSSDYEGEAYQTVTGQNANNSVRVTEAFMDAVVRDDNWDLINRTDGEVYKTVKARDLWDQIAQAAWQSADPGLQFDTTINDWHTCPQSGRINASNPCSEYKFLDNTACNLASLNLVKFLDPSGPGGYYEFNVEDFRHAVQLWTVVLEISVLMGQFPSAEIAQNSYDFRTLGLGYANLGSLLMRLGYPYDSEEGRAIAAGITALMTGESYAASAEMAMEFGPFPRFHENRDDMLRVINNHYQATLPDPKFDGLSIKPVSLSPLCPEPIADAAVQAWQTALDFGSRHGFRNAQVTLLAPTGTIGMVMDCDTTGIEPDYSLVKFKKLSGGGVVTIVNDSVDDALAGLGYDVHEQDRIVRHIVEHGTIEGAPDLKDEHLSIFDCANSAGSGVRFIRPSGHIQMMAAVQPFLSGAISKTVNLPADATVENVESAYMSSYLLGLKAVALYRDGSKLSQPLNSQKEEKKADQEKPTPEYRDGYRGTAHTPDSKPPRTGTAAHPPAQRRKMPVRRLGFTQEGTIAGHKLFVRTGEYEDGTLGEIFIDMHKEGAAFRSLMNCFGIAVSKGLQYGVPLEEFVESFTHQKFEPQGMVQGHPNIKMASSIIDYIFRVLALEYLGRSDLAQVPPENNPTPVTVTVNGHANTENGHSLFTYEQARDAFEAVHESFTLPDVMWGEDSSAGFTGDVSFCDQCGNTMIRAGSCYACTGCGATTGCS